MFRHQIEHQVRLGNRLQTLGPQLARLEVPCEGKRVCPHSKLAQARKQKAIWERQLRSALERENQARQAVCQHQ